MYPYLVDYMVKVFDDIVERNTGGSSDKSVFNSSEAIRLRKKQQESKKSKKE